MPTIEVKKAQTDCKQLQVIIDLAFPPKTVDSEGTVSYGKISHVESKGVDADGNAAGNVYWYHDEVPAETKAKLVGILLTDLPPLLATAAINVDFTPTPFEAPVVEEPTPEVIEEPTPEEPADE